MIWLDNFPVHPKSDGNLSFDPKNNANIFMKFYSNLASDLVGQLPTAPKKFGIDTVKNIMRNIS